MPIHRTPAAAATLPGFGMPADAVAALAELSRLRALIAEQVSRYDGALRADARFAAGRDEPAVIRSPRDAYNLVAADMSVLEQEQMRVILVNSKNQVLDVHTLYQGTINSSPVRIAEMFREAIRQNALSIILVHNHPSGDPTPSPEDVTTTTAAVSAGRLLDVEVLDHVIVGASGGCPPTGGRFVSLKERGLGFTS